MSVAKVVKGTEITLDKQPITVAGACDQNSGQWMCVTHDVGFQNQMAKDSHIAEGDDGDPCPKHRSLGVNAGCPDCDQPIEHVLAWLCFVHGPEVP